MYLYTATKNWTKIYRVGVSTYVSSFSWATALRKHSRGKFLWVYVIYTQTNYRTFWSVQFPQQKTMNTFVLFSTLACTEDDVCLLGIYGWGFVFLCFLFHTGDSLRFFKEFHMKKCQRVGTVPKQFWFCQRKTLPRV